MNEKEFELLWRESLEFEPEPKDKIAYLLELAERVLNDKEKMSKV